jgi:hypothetical protein
MLNNKLRSNDVTNKPSEDVFAIDTVLVMLSSNENSHNEIHIDLGEWGNDFKLFSYDGFAYAINDNFILYLTYPQVKTLNKEDRKDILLYRFGEEGSKDKRKPRYGDVCLYYGRVVASKPNKAGKPSFEARECDREAIMDKLNNDVLVAIHSSSGEVGYVPKDLSEGILNALLMRFPRGL